MSCSEISTSLEAERAQYGEEDEHAGDDRRRPVGMQSCDLTALRESHRGEPAQDPLGLGRESS